MKALVNYEVASAFAKKTAIDVISLPPYNKLDLPVAAHPDMLFCVLDDTVFCYKDYVLENSLYSLLENEGYNVVFVSNICDKVYPLDISLNVLVMGKTLFCNVKHTAKEIIDYGNDNGYSIVNVKQGYSACSTLVIDENTAITSDIGILSAIEKAGKNAILIKNDDIILSGYNCGFIGGATGKIENDVFIFGEIELISEYKEISVLLESKGCKIVPVLSGRVYDFGGIKLI